MRLALPKASSAWLPTALVLAVVLLAGSRLVVLSLERNADDARAAARVALTRHRTALESQFVALATRASREAVRASQALVSGVRAKPTTPGPGTGAFLVTATDEVMRSAPSDTVRAAGIMSEWSAADARGGSETRFFGPTRQGSQWLVAARAPIGAPGQGADTRVGWAVAYADLDRLTANAGLGRLVAEGYDFSLVERDAAGTRTRAFEGSGSEPLDEAVRSIVRIPPELAAGSGRGDLELAVRPREGWYPASRLAAEIGLLALLAWLLAFGTHDLVHKSRRLRAQLTDAQRRQVQLGEQLVSAVEDRQRLQQSIDHSRYHDAFTGLPNRRFFMDQLDRALREMRARRRRGIAVALIDIDRFKLITETLGHAAGDELMVQAAKRFEHAAMGPDSVLARWDGHQFALLLSDVPTRDVAVGIAGRIQLRLREPFDLRRHRLSIAASIGTTCADSGLERAEDLLREAHIALSVAKRLESGRIIAYAPAMGGDAASLVSLEADLHLALERNELRLLFQPIIDLRTRQTVGAEALLRWQHPVEGLLRPDAFLSIAEEAGLMVPITRWVIARVCRIAGEWRQRLDPPVPFYLSINASMGALRDPYLADYLGSTLMQTDAAAASLKFEITEAGLISNVGEAREALHRLHDMGIELMLDDFGTGYSSLNHLELFPFDFVKIDRPFASRVGVDTANGAIMAAVVQIASSLGLRAIAEVIETQAVAQALQKMGCDYGQGYFFSAPVEAEEVLQRLRGTDRTMTMARARGGPDDDSPTLALPVISR
jgi:diguanylate cyclase (GGDEF)-like protein